MLKSSYAPWAKTLVTHGAKKPKKKGVKVELPHWGKEENLYLSPGQQTGLYGILF